MSFAIKTFVQRNSTSVYAASRGVSSLVSKLEKAVADLPHREAVRYKDKNIKWSAANVNQLVDGHANVMLEPDYHFEPNTCVVHWMPDGREKHITSLAAAKLGLKIFDMDIAINTVKDIRECLAQAECRMIVFDPEDDRLNLLRKAIPEFYHYNDSNGQWFHSKYYPNLKFFLHTGFDIEMGCLNLKRWSQPTPVRTVELEKRMQSLTDDMPLYRRATIGASGLEVSAWLSHADVEKQKTFILANKLANKEYFEM
jgi:hypothetical protein